MEHGQANSCGRRPVGNRPNEEGGGGQKEEGQALPPPRSKGRDCRAGQAERADGRPCKIDIFDTWWRWSEDWGLDLASELLDGQNVVEPGRQREQGVFIVVNRNPVNCRDQVTPGQAREIPGGPLGDLIHAKPPFNPGNGEVNLIEALNRPDQRCTGDQDGTDRDGGVYQAFDPHGYTAALSSQVVW